MGENTRSILLIVDIPIYYFIFKKIFKSKDEFFGALKYYFRPNLISVAKGEYFKDRENERKIGKFLAICILIFLVEEVVLSKILIYFGLNY